MGEWTVGWRAGWLGGIGGWSVDGWRDGGIGMYEYEYDAILMNASKNSILLSLKE